MHYTDRRFQLDKYLIMIWIICAENICYLFPISNGYFFWIRMGIIFLLIGYYVVADGHVDMSIGKYILAVIIFLVFQYVYTSVTYAKQSNGFFFYEARSYLYVFFCYPLYQYFKHNDSIEDILDTVLVVVMCVYIVEMITAIMYNAGLSPLFNVAYYRNFSIRAGRVRIVKDVGLHGIAFVWSWYKAFYRKHGIIYFLCGVFIIIEVFWVDQTRGMLAALILTFLALLVFRPIKLANSKWIKGFLVILGGALFFLMGIYDNIKLSVSARGELGANTQVRLDEMTYAIKLFINHPLTGHGLMLNKVRDYYIHYTGMGYFGYTDIGIVGQLAKLGLPCLYLIYIGPMIHFGKIAIECFKEKIEGYEVLIGLMMYLLSTTPTIIVLNYDRLLLWPFCIAIFAFYEERYIHIVSS